MRLVLVPLSFKTSMVFCQDKSYVAARGLFRIEEKVAVRAIKLWTAWRGSRFKWKRAVINLADKALETISYDEWGLKSVPARLRILHFAKSPASPQGSWLSAQQVDKDRLANPSRIEILYPGTVVSESQVMSKLGSLADAIPLHRKYFYWSLLAAPLTFPFAFIPIVPNLPGIYLLFRAWSHWKALQGAKHVKFLLDHAQITPISDPGLCHLFPASAKCGAVLTESLVEKFATAISTPSIIPELHRAIRQTRNHLHAASDKN